MTRIAVLVALDPWLPINEFRSNFVFPFAPFCNDGEFVSSFSFSFFFRVLFYSFVWVFFIHSQIVLLRWFYGFIKYLFICFRFGYVLMLFPCHHCRCKLFPPTFFTPLNGFGLINDLTFLFTGLTDGWKKILHKMAFGAFPCKFLLPYNA